MKSNLPGYAVTIAVSLACILIISIPLTEAEANCPVSVPETRLLGQEGSSNVDWFGSDALAVLLPSDGIWRGMGSERNFFDKLFWLAGGFQPGKEGDFSVTGRLLDDIDSSLEPLVSGVTNAHHEDFGGWAILAGIGFPETGCWEVTGSFEGQELKFVVQVVGAETRP